MSGESQTPETIFGEAIEISSQQDRAMFLDRACQGNADLRREVERLVENHFQAGSFLESPALDERTIPIPSVAERPGTVIGPYKLLQQIGEGGMGVVFMAEQTEPIQRTVALKIIKPGMDTRQVIARFEAERQALAMMDHPNIAKVLDAGTTESGRPYFVMELVKGIAITKYCDEKHLPLRARLDLFIEVCQAVQHAHQKGIIHRDIKPNNVLVAEYDNHAAPKVIDFGVAKATAHRLTERTMFTEFGQVLGTVEYMSPEQAKFNQLDIDTRSDIYSLGVMLYELLTGSTPFERERLREAAFDEVLRIIREEEPPKPSTRLSTSETLPSIAANRHTEPAQLSKDVSGELDWIVMKCLDKDRSRRYETANGLATDLERYLHDEAVTACPPSTAYRLRKFVRRNKVGILAGSAIVAALIVGMALAILGFVQSRRQAIRADAAAVRATSTNEYLQRMLQSTDPDKRNGQEITVRQLLDEFSMGLSNQFASQPVIEADIQRTIGLAYRRLDANKCEEHLRRAMELRRALVGDRHIEFADSMVDYAIALREQWRPSDSESYLRRALKIFKQQGTHGRPVIRALEILQIDLILQHRLPEIEATFNEAIAEANQSQLKQSPEIANMYHGLIIAKVGETKYDEAEVLARQSIAMQLRLRGQYHPETGWAYCNLGRALVPAHKFADALDALHEAVVIFQHSLPPGHLDTIATLDRLTAALQLVCQSDQLSSAVDSPQKLDKLAAAYRAALPVNANLIPRNPTRGPGGQFAPGRAPLVTALNRPIPGIAMAVQDGLMELAEVCLKLETQCATAGDTKLADKYIARAKALQDEARLLSPRVSTEVQRAFEEAKDDANQLLASESADPQAWNQAAWMLIISTNPARRDPRLAIELAVKASQLRPSDGSIWNTLGAARLRAGDSVGAIKALEKSLELKKGGDATDWFLLAIANWQLDHKKSSRVWFDKAVEWMDKNQSHDIELPLFRAEATELLGITDLQPSADPKSTDNELRNSKP